VIEPPTKVATPEPIKEVEVVVEAPTKVVTPEPI